jgi:hypothetical protein
MEGRGKNSSAKKTCTSIFARNGAVPLPNLGSNRTQKSVIFFAFPDRHLHFRVTRSVAGPNGENKRKDKGKNGTQRERHVLGAKRRKKE